jgi:DNA helicase HerA-like ATPase
MTVQLVGEIVETSFERGISQYPAINDEVHLVTEEDLHKIYGSASPGSVVIGRLAGAESIPVHVDLDRLVTRHSAVLGSTGSGKSTSVASLLRSLAGDGQDSPFPNSRILLVDVHGEYGSALTDVATTFRVNPKSGEEQLFVPFWTLDSDELLDFLFGRLDDKALIAIQDKILAAKSQQAASGSYGGIEEESLTPDSPIPFSLKSLWSELIDPEVKTWSDQARTTAALIEPADPETLTPPKYEAPGAGNQLPHINNVGVLGIRRQLQQMRSRMLDRQYSFMLRPGPWEPNLNGDVTADLPELLRSWFGHDKPITILDVSGIPSAILHRLLGGILNTIYQALFWGREKEEGGRCRPELIVMEEAHRYLGKDHENPARLMLQRIVKEGRKFGVGAMLVSQRPSEIDETILSQCGTFIAMRLSNSGDRAKVQSVLPDSLRGVVESLPVLRTGEAIVVGEAAKLPIRCRVTLPPEGKRPNSEDPQVSTRWAQPRATEDYRRLSGAWRSQNPGWEPQPDVETSNG